MDDIITTVVAAANSYDLTDLDTVKSELNISASDVDNDKSLQRAISRVSQSVANECNRIFPVETVSDLFFLDRPRQVLQSDNKIQLSRWPILSVASVIEDAGMATECALVQGTDYLVMASTGQLMRLDATAGLRRRWRSRTLTVQYDAGYGTGASKIAAIPNSTPFAITPDCSFDLDKGVIFTGGAPLVEVDGTPAAGEYSVAGGVYTFSSADAGKSVTISYVKFSVPNDIVEATLRLVTMYFKAKGRDPMVMQQDQPGLGLTRFWVGTTPGQTGAFPPEIDDLLSNYRVPVAA